MNVSFHSVYMCMQSQVNQIWGCVEEKKNRIMLLKKMIETEERTIALEKAIEIQVSIIVYTYSMYSVMVLPLTASKSWTSEQQAPTTRATLLCYGKGPGCNMP